MVACNFVETKMVLLYYSIKHTIVIHCGVIFPWKTLTSPLGDNSLLFPHSMVHRCEIISFCKRLSDLPRVIDIFCLFCMIGAQGVKDHTAFPKSTQKYLFIPKTNNFHITIFCRLSIVEYPKSNQNA